MSCESHGPQTRGLFFWWTSMALQRVITFVDGLNLYHAIASLQRQELHWVDLRALSKVFFNSKFEQLIHVFYFSAYAQHVAESNQKCQKAYIKALELTAVKPVLPPASIPTADSM